jgi:hypothetical protein
MNNAHIKHGLRNALPCFALVTIYFVGVLYWQRLGQSIFSFLIAADEIQYGGLAKNLARHGAFLIEDGFPAAIPPLYSLAIAPVFLERLVQSAVPALVWLNAALMCSVVFPVYLMCRSFHLHRALALILSALSISVPQMYFVGTVMSENLFYPLLIWCIYAAMQFNPKKMRSSLILGLLLALCMLTKLISLALLGAVGLALLFGLCTRTYDLRSFLKALPSLAVSFLIITVPWMLLKGSQRGYGSTGMVGGYEGNYAHLAHISIRQILYHLGDLALFSGCLAVPISLSALGHDIFRRRSHLSPRLRYQIACCIFIPYAFLALAAIHYSESVIFSERYFFFGAVPLVIAMMAYVRDVDFNRGFALWLSLTLALTLGVVVYYQRSYAPPAAITPLFSPWIPGMGYLSLLDQEVRQVGLLAFGLLPYCILAVMALFFFIAIYARKLAVIVLACSMIPISLAGIQGVRRGLGYAPGLRADYLPIMKNLNALVPDDALLLVVRERYGWQPHSSTQPDKILLRGPKIRVFRDAFFGMRLCAYMTGYGKFDYLPVNSMQRAVELKDKLSEYSRIMIIAPNWVDIPGAKLVSKIDEQFHLHRLSNVDALTGYRVIPEKYRWEGASFTTQAGSVVPGAFGFKQALASRGKTGLIVSGRKCALFEGHYSLRGWFSCASSTECEVQCLIGLGKGRCLTRTLKAQKAEALMLSEDFHIPSGMSPSLFTFSVKVMKGSIRFHGLELVESELPENTEVITKLDGGWYDSEAWGRWAASATPSLEIHSASHETVTLAFRVGSFMEPATMDIVVAGKLLKTVEVAAKKGSVTAPTQVMVSFEVQPGVTKVVFKGPEKMFVPSEMKRWNDPRPLRLAFSHISVNGKRIL